MSASAANFNSFLTAPREPHSTKPNVSKSRKGENNVRISVDNENKRTIASTSKSRNSAATTKQLESQLKSLREENERLRNSLIKQEDTLENQQQDQQQQEYDNSIPQPQPAHSVQFAPNTFVSQSLPQSSSIPQQPFYEPPVHKFANYTRENFQEVQEDYERKCIELVNTINRLKYTNEHYQIEQAMRMLQQLRQEQAEHLKYIEQEYFTHKNSRPGSASSSVDYRVSVSSRVPKAHPVSPAQKKKPITGSAHYKFWKMMNSKEMERYPIRTVEEVRPFNPYQSTDSYNNRDYLSRSYSLRRSSSAPKIPIVDSSPRISLHDEDEHDFALPIPAQSFEIQPKKKELTIPEPFSFEMRESQKRKSISKQRFESYVGILKDFEEKQSNFKFQALPIPLTTSLPRYEELKLRRRDRSREIKNMAMKKLKDSERPFSFVERDHEKFLAKSGKYEQYLKDLPKKFQTKFIANPVPSVVQSSMLSKMKEQEEERKRRIRELAEEKLRQASLPPRMQLHHEHKEAQKENIPTSASANFSFRPKINKTVPDFQLLQSQFQEELQKIRKRQKNTKIVEFKFHDKFKFLDSDDEEEQRRPKSAHSFFHDDYVTGKTKSVGLHGLLATPREKQKQPNSNTNKSTKKFNTKRDSM